MATAMSNGTAAGCNITAASNTTMPTRVYDARGAMMFTIATVLVYGMSIVAFIAGHLRRRHQTKEEESQIAKYLKRADEIRRQGVQDDVLKLRSQLLAGSVIVTNQNSERRKSRVERAKQYILNDINCAALEGNRTPSAESVILPACTIPAPCSEADDNQTSTPASLEVSSTTSEQDSVFSTLEEERGDSNVEDSGDDNVPESRSFIQTHGGGLTRFSLHASLEQSVINGNSSRPQDNEQNDSPEGSPDFNKSRKYRSRRRGGVLNVPLSMGPPM